MTLVKSGKIKMYWYGWNFENLNSIYSTNYSFSKLVCAEVSKTTGASKRVFHQTVNAQNSMLTKEIHDQGKINFILI